MKITEAPNERTKENDIQEILFHWEGSQTLAHIAQRCYVASILSHIQKQIGVGLEQPALVDSILSRGLGQQDVSTTNYYNKFPTSASLWFSLFYYLRRNYRWRRSNKSTLDNLPHLYFHSTLNSGTWPLMQYYSLHFLTALIWNHHELSQEWSVAKIICNEHIASHRTNLKSQAWENVLWVCLSLFCFHTLLGLFSIFLNYGNFIDEKHYERATGCFNTYRIFDFSAIFPNANSLLLTEITFPSGTLPTWGK